ncbi:MAG: hypothetical protein U9R15_14945, partial [Chloroflexota bacterium]|nr:hypothetical protein [Chloroflexota bacterium]
RNMFALYERIIARGNRSGSYVVQAQSLQANVRQTRGKLHFLPGIPKMHMAGLPEFIEDPQRTMDIFGEILETAKGFYEFRVIDLGPDFNLPIHWAAIQKANTVLLVVTPERTAITDVKNILPTLARQFGTLQKFRLVLNGFDEQFGISPKEVVKFLEGKVTIVGTLPYAPTETRLAINEGQPVVGQKKLGPIGEAFVRLAANFYPPLEAIGAKRGRKKKKSGLLGMFMGG